MLGYKMDWWPRGSGPALNWSDWRKAWPLTPAQMKTWGRRKSWAYLWIIGRDPRCGKLSELIAYWLFLCPSLEENIFNRVVEPQSSSLQELGGGWTFWTLSCWPVLGWIYALVPGNRRICLCLYTFRQLLSTVFYVVLCEMLLDLLQKIFLKYMQEKH